MQREQKKEARGKWQECEAGEVRQASMQVRGRGAQCMPHIFDYPAAITAISSTTLLRSDKRDAYALRERCYCLFARF